MTIFSEFDRQQEVAKLVTAIREAEAVIPSQIEVIDKTVKFLDEKLDLFQEFVDADFTSEDDVQAVLLAASPLLRDASRTLTSIQALVERAQQMGIGLPE